MNMYHDADRALLDPMETASVDALRQHQLERLRWSLKHAYDNVPLYRQRFAECGAHPDDLKCLKDLAKFPFTGKNDLRDNYPYGMFAVPQQEVVRLHASSGTTGKPTVVGYTRTTSTPPMWSPARSVPRVGARGQGACLLRLRPVHRRAWRALRCRAPGLHGDPHVRWPDREAGAADSRLPARHHHGHPSYMLNLADEIERQGIDPQDPSCAWAYSAPSRGPTSCAARSSNGWASMPRHLWPVGNHGAWCGDGVPRNQGWPDHLGGPFLPRDHRPVTGAVLPDGQLGELVFTSLSKEAPMVRYRTRDLTRLLPGTARPMRRIGKITGRSDDMLIIRGVNVFPTQIEEQVLKIKQLSELYEIHLYRNGNLDSVEVHGTACGVPAP